MAPEIDRTIELPAAPGTPAQTITLHIYEERGFAYLVDSGVEPDESSTGAVEPRMFVDVPSARSARSRREAHYAQEVVRRQALPCPADQE